MKNPSVSIAKGFAIIFMAIVSLKYRGDGWPDYFHAVWQDGSEFKLTNNKSCGKVLGRQVGFRCKICPDGVGMLADIAVGDRKKVILILRDVRVNALLCSELQKGVEFMKKADEVGEYGKKCR